MKGEKRRKSPVAIGREVGTIVGGIGFVYIGLLYGVVYGGYLGLIVARALFGTPIPPSIWARGLTVLGITLGVITSAALFIGIGAALGRALGTWSRWLWKIPAPRKRRYGSRFVFLP